MTTEGMYESKYIKPCTPELALKVGKTLRWEDKREVEETTGLTAPAAVLESYYRSSVSVFFVVPNGKAAGVAGITPDNLIWMLCTQAWGGYTSPRTRDRQKESRPSSA